ncbi:MAG: hypothetical protein IJU23_11165 [Proteobacteria bacterium]|nr:hypothetical protein [Pseudomonadota bacterium]
MFLKLVSKTQTKHKENIYEEDYNHMYAWGGHAGESRLLHHKFIYVAILGVAMFAASCGDNSSADSDSCNEHEVISGNACICDNATNYYGESGSCVLCDGKHKVVKRNECVCEDGFKADDSGICTETKETCGEHQVEKDSKCVCDNASKYYGSPDNCQLCNEEDKEVKDNKCVCKEGFKADENGGCTKEKETKCGAHQDLIGDECVCESDRYVKSGDDCILETCTLGNNKCGTGADANIFYTCTDEGVYNKGNDCTSMGNHFICGNVIKYNEYGAYPELGCGCDRANNWYENSNGVCELQCAGGFDPTPSNDECICDASKHRAEITKGMCECDYKNGWTYSVDEDNVCVCDASLGLIEDNNGKCVCDIAGNWEEKGDGTCTCSGEVEKVFGRYCYKNFKEKKVGDVVTFGNYYQSNESTKEPIEWIILDIDHKEHGYLLISKYAIVSYHNEHVNAGFSWKDSNTRSFLVNTFYKDAFSASEMALMMSKSISSVTTDPDDSSPVTSNDKVFILSKDECETLIKKPSDRLALSTYYSCKMSDSNATGCTHLKYNSTWILRSPIYVEKKSGSDPRSYFPYVHNEDGSIKDSYGSVYLDMRPVIFVKY